MLTIYSEKQAASKAQRYFPTRKRAFKTIESLMFIYFTHVWPMSDTGQVGDIEFLLGTVNDAIASAPMELYRVAAEIWQKCYLLSPIAICYL